MESWLNITPTDWSFMNIMNIGRLAKAYTSLIDCKDL